ncbi:4'-phosphopantetheinyl transferase family protein [Blattabacterium cuenoti]|uniref:4'-phosphopantetheinyl transferase family protein n=1 Tax=Blattabacterium cuenoti TaxID=1653831 RepID=UPI001CC25751|nr:4'-phosphopantetheinyl transferase superfamily protein [Blattabacterium cuenoti]
MSRNKKKIFYDKNRKPFLMDPKKYISFSHSYERTAVAVSCSKIGIDIERVRTDKKIITIQQRFIRKDESIFILPNYEEDYLHIIWGIKESLYKLVGGLYYSFINHYKVSPFYLHKEDCVSCWIINNSHSQKFSAFYKKIENHYLVYIIDK